MFAELNCVKPGQDELWERSQQGPRGTVSTDLETHQRAWGPGCQVTRAFLRQGVTRGVIIIRSDQWGHYPAERSR